MFETTLQLRVSKSEFFNLLIDSIQGEYEHYTNKKIDRDKVKGGLTYKKTSGSKKKPVESTVKIEKLVKDQLYQSKVKNGGVTSTLRYIIADAEHDDEIVVTFQQETIMGNGKPQKAGMFAKYQEKKQRRHTVALLRQMEDYIISERDKEEEASEDAE